MITYAVKIVKENKKKVKRLEPRPFTHERGEQQEQEDKDEQKVDKKEEQ